MKTFSGVIKSYNPVTKEATWITNWGQCVNPDDIDWQKVDADMGVLHGRFESIGYGYVYGHNSRNITSPRNRRVLFETEPKEEQMEKIAKGDIAEITLSWTVYKGQVISSDYDSHRETYNVEIDCQSPPLGYTYWKQFSDGGSIRKVGEGPTVNVDGRILIPYDIKRLDACERTTLRLEILERIKREEIEFGEMAGDAASHRMEISDLHQEAQDRHSKRVYALHKMLRALS